MTQLIDIQRVVVDQSKLTARVRIADGAPLFTDEDLEGTTLVYRLLPQIVDHACGDEGESFKEIMGATEVAHLLEHATVELLALSGMLDEVAVGRTFAVEDDPRAFELELDCPDDVLVAGALSSAAWILHWAFSRNEDDPVPDVQAIVDSLVSLTESLGAEAAKSASARKPRAQVIGYPLDPDDDAGHSHVAPSAAKVSTIGAAGYDADGFLTEAEADDFDDSFKGDV